MEGIHFVSLIPKCLPSIGDWGVFGGESAIRAAVIVNQVDRIVLHDYVQETKLNLVQVIKLQNINFLKVYKM